MRDIEIYNHSISGPSMLRDQCQITVSHWDMRRQCRVVFEAGDSSSTIEILQSHFRGASVGSVRRSKK